MPLRSFDFHSRCFCSALLLIQSNKATVSAVSRYQTVSTLAKLLALGIGLAGLVLLAEHNKSRQVPTRQKSTPPPHLRYSTLAVGFPELLDEIIYHHPFVF